MEAKETWNPKGTWETKETEETPGFVPIMRAVQAKELPPDIDWILEPELSGQRVEALISNGTVTYYAKDGSIIQNTCKAIADAFGHVDYDVIIDGEIIITDKKSGAAPASQQKTGNEEGETVYFVFDILFLNGSSILTLPLTERKELLKDFLATISSIHVQCTEYVKGKGAAVLQMARDRKWQKIVAKGANSPYDADKAQWRRTIISERS